MSKIEEVPSLPVPEGYLDHLPTVLHHREHGLIPLFHDTQLHQHRPTSSRDEEVSSISRSHRRGSAGTGVKDQPEWCQTSGDAGMTSITRNTTLRKWTQGDSNP